MTLYAVCFAESIEDEELISVVEARTEEDAIHHHFRKFLYKSDIVRGMIVDPSYEGFFCSYFDVEDFKEFEEIFSAVPSLVQFMKTTFEIYTEAEEKKGSISSALVRERAKLLTSEMCLAVANFLIEVDALDSYAGDAIVTEVEIETA